MNKKFIVAAIATGLAIAIGCSRQNVEPADTAATAARSVKSLLVDNDCQCCDSGTRIDSINYANPVSGMNAGKYRHWDTTIVGLCENGLKIQ